MRSIFEKFDRIPIWVRIGVLLLLIVILITGLFFIKPNYKTSHQSSTVASYSRTSSSKVDSSNEKSSSNPDKAKALDTRSLANAETLVKELEAEQTEENVALSQAAVDKVKDLDAKAKLQDRIQAVKDTIAANRAVNSVQPQIQQQPFYQAQTIQTPAVSSTVDTKTQNEEAPSANTTTQ